MKQTITNFLILLFLIVVCSCSKTYYQIYTVKPIELTIESNDKKQYVYEDDYCKVTYDFWEQNGQMVYFLYNKTDSILYVDKSRSHFITNDMALDYYQDRTDGYSRSYSSYNKYGYAVRWTNDVFQTQYNGLNLISYGGSFSSATSISETRSHEYREKDIIAIPPKTYKIFREYNLWNYYLTKDEINKWTFSVDNTPLNFRNFLTVYLGNRPNKHTVDNSFYISNVHNPSINDMNEPANSVRREKTPQKNDKNIDRLYSPNQFYVVYIK